jgi:hypothetical protein
MFFTYWTDKILFLKFYKIPPQYDDVIAERAINIVKFGLMVHIIMTIYIFSNSDILSVQFESGGLTLGSSINGFFYNFMIKLKVGLNQLATILNLPSLDAI